MYTTENLISVLNDPDIECGSDDLPLNWQDIVANQQRDRDFSLFREHVGRKNGGVTTISLGDQGSALTAFTQDQESVEIWLQALWTQKIQVVLYNSEDKRTYTQSPEQEEGEWSTDAEAEARRNSVPRFADLVIIKDASTRNQICEIYLPHAIRAEPIYWDWRMEDVSWPSGSQRSILINLKKATKLSGTDFSIRGVNAVRVVSWWNRPWRDSEEVVKTTEIKNRKGTRAEELLNLMEGAMQHVNCTSDEQPTPITDVGSNEPK